MTAKTGTPAAAIAAAAWSWVEKMLHEAQRTSAPSATSVSISTAVWIVMCSEPAMRAPFSGLRLAELGAERHQPGHLGLGDVDLLAAEVGEGDVPDDVVPLLDDEVLAHPWHSRNCCRAPHSRGCGPPTTTRSGGG